MFKKYVSKIAVTIQVLLALQIAFFGMNANAVGALAEGPATKLGISYVSPEKVGVGVYFKNSVTVKGDVLEDAKNDKVRLYAVVKNSDEVAVEAADVTIDPILGAGSPAVVTGLEKTVVTEDPNSLVLAWGHAAGFDMSAAYVAAYHDGVTNDFNTKISKAGKYSVDYVFYDKSDSKIIGSSDETQSLEVLPTTINTTYKDEVKYVRASADFTNTVTLKGDTLKDATGSRAYGFIILTRLDDTVVKMDSDDVAISLNGVSGVLPVSPEISSLVSGGNENALVLAWNPFTLLNNFSAGVTSDFNVKIAKEGVYKFQNVIWYEDTENLYGNFLANATYLDEGNTIIVDGKVDIKSVIAIPTQVNDSGKFTKVVVTGNELLDVVEGASFTQGLIQKTKVLSEENKLSNVQTFDIPTDLFKGKEKINFLVKVKDLAGNEKDVTLELTPDATAPLAVKNISAVVGEAGSVVLSWTNPNKLEDYKTVNIYRDGVILTSVPVGTESFVDTNVEKGKTYSYEIVLTDEAGNTAKSISTLVSTPAPIAVASVSSDSAVVVAPKTVGETPEVKSETDTNVVENKKEEKKDSLPIWGLVILLLLVGVGGYLYFSKDEESKPVAPTPVVPLKQVGSTAKQSGKKKNKK